MSMSMSLFRGRTSSFKQSSPLFKSESTNFEDITKPERPFGKNPLQFQSAPENFDLIQPKRKSLSTRNAKRDGLALDAPLNIDEMLEMERKENEKKSEHSGNSHNSSQSGHNSEKSAKSPRRHSVSLAKDHESLKPVKLFPENSAITKEVKSKVKRLRKMSKITTKSKNKKEIEIWEKIAKQMNPLYDKDLTLLEKPFDISNFVIKPTSIFEFSEMGEAMFEHLKKEFNSEPWEFIKLVDDLTNETTKENIEKVFEIVDEFIDPKGEKSLNLSAPTRNDFLDKFQIQRKYETKTWAMDKSIDVVFVKIREIIAQELMLDVFPRFSRTQACIDIVKQYRNNKKLVSPALTLRFTIPDEFFFNPIITDQDLEFFRKAAEDSFDYELISSSNESIRTYFGMHNYLPTVTLVDNLDVYKYEGILSYPLEHLICSLSLHKDQLVYDPACQSYTILKHFPHEKYAELVNETDTDGIESRRGCCISTFDYSHPKESTNYKRSIATTIDYKSDTFIVCNKPVIDDFSKSEEMKKNLKHWKEPKILNFFNKETGEEKEKECYFSFEISLYIYKKIDEQKTHFQQLHFVDIGSGIKQQKKSIELLKN
eukprot:gene12052-5548_t